jgi:predicted nuclease with TOPRIM domain
MQKYKQIQAEIDEIINKKIRIAEKIKKKELDDATDLIGRYTELMKKIEELDNKLKLNYIRGGENYRFEIDGDLVIIRDYTHFRKHSREVLISRKAMAALITWLKELEFLEEG